jgi:hypothetical protein
MFLRYFVEVPVSVDRVERALLTSPAGWLSATAGVALERGDGLLTEVGVGPLPTRFRRRVTIQLGEDRTQLAISARYRPPRGVVGRAVDRALLHRVAEATLKDFLDRVGQALTRHSLVDDPRQVAGQAGGAGRDAP